MVASIDASSEVDFSDSTGAGLLSSRCTKPKIGVMFVSLLTVMPFESSRSRWIASDGIRRSGRSILIRREENVAAEVADVERTMTRPASERSRSNLRKRRTGSACQDARLEERIRRTHQFAGLSPPYTSHSIIR